MQSNYYLIISVCIPSTSLWHWWIFSEIVMKSFESADIHFANQTFLFSGYFLQSFFTNLLENLTSLYLVSVVQ